ncbi:MAG: hypothetical protein OER04_10415 [Cyclobacteriaceae bacterium]|nr:hypothetical protein [Cyclobacteriaceae bacterium]
MKRIHLIPFMILSLVLWTSCESDLNEDPGNPGNPVITNVDPDKASEYLVLNNAAKITGSLPLSNDGGLKLDVEDTIFTMKGYPLGSRIRVLHDPSQSVSDFNIHVGGASFYYNVPEEIAEDQYIVEEESDTTSVLVLELDPPADEVDYPFTLEVYIQPLDESGNPLDEFIRWLTVEDPEDSGSGGCNSITGKVWEWNFSLRINHGDIVNVWAPALGTPINTTGGGCCSGSGNSYTTVDPFCVVGINEPNMKWVEVTPHDYYVRNYEYLQFGDDGSALADGLEIIKNWDLFNTDFCSETLSYTYTENKNKLVEGTHDFVRGANHINFSFPDWEGGWRPRGGNIVYTCNVLVISYDVEIDTFIKVYKEWDGTQIVESEVIWHD